MTGLDLDAFPVHVGACVVTGRRFRRVAHAHIRGSHRGWICVLSAKRTTDPVVMLHEIAHILAGQGHTQTWRRKLLEIGGTLSQTEGQKDYHQRSKERPKHRGDFREHLDTCPCAEVQP